MSNGPNVAERLRRAERYLDAMGSAGPGEGDKHAYRACKVGWGFDLHESEFWPLLAKWNAGTTSPRDERELANKLSSVYRRTEKARGWLVEGSEQRTAQDPTPPKKAREPKYPPQDEVLKFWEALRYVPDVPKVAAWVEMRGITYAKLGHYPELALRALPGPVMDPWPTWACAGERPDGSLRPWYESEYQAITPLFDSRGTLRSFKARWVGRTGSSPPAKSVPPRNYDISRLFMASIPAVFALMQGAWQDPTCPELRMVEGEPDHLSTIQRIHESDRQGRGVIGIFSGAISIDLLRRIPAGTRVVYDGHQDRAGKDYLDNILKLARTTGLGATLASKKITFTRAVRDV